MKRKTWILAAVIVAILAAAALFLSGLFRARGFETVLPKRGEIVEAVYGLGKVKSVHRFEVKLGVMSTVKKLYVREGEFVQRGDKLIEFESNALFRAPFAGTVTLINNYDGESAVPNVPILRLEDLKERFIELSLEQDGALRIKPGQSAKVSFENLRGKVLKAKVGSLFARDDEFLAHIDVLDPLDESVLPGMTADVTVEIGKIPDALMIPVKAVTNGTVLVRRDGRRRKVKVEIGHVDGLMAEVTGGDLRENDEVLMRKADL